MTLKSGLEVTQDYSNWYQKALPDCEKYFEDMYNRLDRIPACDGRTDKPDILSRHSPRYAYASRGKNWVRDSTEPLFGET